MKILMFGWEFPPYISGGLGTACFGLTRSLKNQNMDITFVLPKIKGELHNPSIRIISGQNFLMEEMDNFEKNSVHFAKYVQVASGLTPYMTSESYNQQRKEEKDLFTEYKAHSIDFSGDYGDDLISEVARYALMGRYLGKKEQYDLIHAHDWMTYLAGIEAKRVSGKPLVVHIHATEYDRCGEFGNTNIMNIEKYGLEMADQVIAVSQRTKDLIVEKYNIDPNKVHVVHNGVDPDQLTFLDYQNRVFKDDKVVLFLGRITMQKGPDYFIEAANLVLQQMKNVRFIMAGSGDMTRRLIERMAALRIADRFHFTGFLNKDERERVFAISDLYVMPSVSEPFGITPLEAMRYNIPIIISKQSGVAEVLDHVIKVDFWDIQKLASAIINILKNPPMAKSLVENNYGTIDRMDWGTAAQKVVQVYQRCF